MAQTMFSRSKDMKRTQTNQQTFLHTFQQLLKRMKSISRTKKSSRESPKSGLTWGFSNSRSNQENLYQADTSKMESPTTEWQTWPPSSEVCQSLFSFRRLTTRFQCALPPAKAAECQHLQTSSPTPFLSTIRILNQPWRCVLSSALTSCRSTTCRKR